jgi:hypothetical protein
MSDDPRVNPLVSAALKILVKYNYNAHFTGLEERAVMETRLFLARLDALREHEQIPVFRAPVPIPMILFCPSCGVQHIDNPEGDWTNPPHRSHLCGYCGHIWRPADVSTNGVKEITTTGKEDTPDKVRRNIVITRRFNPRWRHHKGGLFVEIGRGTPIVQDRELPHQWVAYQSEDNRIWFRYETEFEDGRFERI